MKPMILFDIDGVLARYTCGALALHGRSEHSGQWDSWNFQRGWGIEDPAFYAGQNRDFWANLGVWEDGMALFRFVESLVGQDRLVLLTAPVQTEGCCEGKRDWVKKHLPHYLPDLVIGGPKHKLAHRGALLIDDSDANREKFSAAGGWTWCVPRPWNEHKFLCAADGTFNVLSQCDRIKRFLEGLA